MLVEPINLNSSLTVLQLYPSDYELVLTELVERQSDNNSPVIYWNSGFSSLVKLRVEGGELRYGNPLRAIQDINYPMI